MTTSWTPENYPWFKLFPKDVLSSARFAGMSAAQRGIYCTLLFRSWVEDGLPDDPDELALLAMVSPDELAEAWRWPLMGAFSMKEDGRMRNRRLEVERSRATEERDARSRGGKKSPPKPTKPPNPTRKSLPSHSEDSSKSAGGDPCKEKEKEKENYPPTPLARGASSLDLAGELAALASSRFTGGRLVRAGEAAQRTWATQVLGVSGGADVPLAVWRRTVARLLAAGSTRWPSVNEMAAELIRVLESAATGAPPLSRVIESARAGEGSCSQALDQAGIPWKEPSFLESDPRHVAAWRAHQAIARIIREDTDR